MKGSILSAFEQVLLHIQLTVVRTGQSNIYIGYPQENKNRPAAHLHRGNKYFGGKD